LLRPLLIEAAQTGINFEEQIIVDAQAGIQVRRLVGAADEQRRRGQQREGERDLHHDERIAREEAPASPDRVFARLFLQVADDAVARKLQGRPERERERPKQAEDERRAEDREVRRGVPDEVDRHEMRIDPASRVDDHKPTMSPAAPPRSASSNPSVRSCRTTRHRLLPSARRMAISLRRAVPRASSMFARFRQATSNTTAAIPINIGAIASNELSSGGLSLIENRETGRAMNVCSFRSTGNARSRFVASVLSAGSAAAYVRPPSDAR
jgi:hypothetical protein